jgi:hypothetical protein
MLAGITHSAGIASLRACRFFAAIVSQLMATVRREAVNCKNPRRVVVRPGWVASGTAVPFVYNQGGVHPER